MQSNNIVLYSCIAVLVLGLVLWAYRRDARARAQAERAQREAEREDLGGNSYFLPPAPIEQAIEIANPVEIDSLLSGEPESVAAAAREQLEQVTDIGDIGNRGIPLSLAIPQPPTIQINPSDARIPPAAEPEPASAKRPPGWALATAPKPAPEAPGPDGATKVPVRDLVLAWYEARGYRASTPLSKAGRIELILRHIKDPDRNYAFVVEPSRVTAERSAALLSLAKTAGFQRLLIAAEAGFVDGLPAKLKKRGIRIFNEAAILEQLAKIDISIAAKIIAVARSRAVARHAAHVAAAVRFQQRASGGVPTQPAIKPYEG